MITRMVRHGLLALAATVTLTVVAPSVDANEHIMMLPASGFLANDDATALQRNNGNNGYALGEGLYYFPVIFPKAGRNVCEVRLYVRDFDDPGDAVARLVRKGVGASTTFSDVTEMASVSSTGFDQAMRSFATMTITQPLITAGYFYFVEVELPVGNNMQFLGVRIRHQPTC